MTIHYSAGAKGGVGKSMLAASIISALLSAGRRVALIEGDASQPDIALRYDELVELAAVNLNRSGASEEAIIAFTTALEKMPVDADIVVNLPAAADDTLDELAELLVGAGQELGHESRVYYSLGHQAPSTASAINSLNKGLLGAVPAGSRRVVYPAFLAPVERFDFVTSGARDRVVQGGQIGEAVMPALKPDSLATKVLALPGAFSDIATNPDAGLTFGERLMFKKWLADAHASASTLLT